MIDWESGEYIDNSIIKKKIILIKDEKEIDFKETIDDITKKFADYTKRRFDEIDATLLPLARYVASSKEDIMSVLLGFAIGSEFERQKIKIKTVDIELTDKEKSQFNIWKMGAYDFFVDELLSILKRKKEDSDGKGRH